MKSVRIPRQKNFSRRSPTIQHTHNSKLQKSSHKMSRGTTFFLILSIENWVTHFNNSIRIQKIFNNAVHLMHEIGQNYYHYLSLHKASLCSAFPLKTQDYSITGYMYRLEQLWSLLHDALMSCWIRDKFKFTKHSKTCCTKISLFKYCRKSR